jgi:hypothetical protein
MAPPDSRPPDDPSDDWADAPLTSPDRDRHDTPPHDLTALARATASPEAHEDALRLAYSEGQEDVVRALYAVCRAHGLTREHMDHIVLDVRLRLTRL